MKKKIPYRSFRAAHSVLCTFCLLSILFLHSRCLSQCRSLWSCHLVGLQRWRAQRFEMTLEAGEQCVLRFDRETERDVRGRAKQQNEDKCVQRIEGQTGMR